MCAGPINGKKPRRKSDELIRSSRMTQRVKRSSFSSTGSTVSTSAIPTNRTKHSTQRETLSGRWVQDAECRECRNCHKSFSLMTRRHHCRICGHIFCNACSRTRLVLSTSPDEIPRRRRVCDPCAAHANESVYMNGVHGLRKTSFDSSERSTDIVVPSDIDLHNPSSEKDEAATLHFLIISLICFLGAFWFLKDEVSYTNPAFWMVIAGCIKNSYDLGMFLMNYYQLNGEKSMEDDGEYPVDGTVEVDADQVAKPQVGLRLSEEQKVEMLSNAHKAMDKLWELGSTSEGWTSEAPQAEQTSDVQLYSRDNKPVRIYKCTAVIDLSPDALFDILYNGFETSSSWNVTVMENKVLNVLNENTDVVHMVTKPCLGGMVTSRDFVNTRTWRKQNGGYVIGSVCAGKNLLKSGKGITRGINGPTGFIILPIEEFENKCNFIWVMDCDIKGFFPGSVIKKGTLSEMWCFVRNLRRYMAKMKNADDANTITTTNDATETVNAVPVPVPVPEPSQSEETV